MLGLAPTPNHHQVANLPTGRGIQTAWHSEGGASNEDPAWKKTKYVHSSAPVPQLNGGFPQAHQQHTPATIPVQHHQQSQSHQPRSSSALTGRLGFQMRPTGSTANPDVMHNQHQAPLSQEQTNGVSLPIGVGVRVPGAIQVHQAPTSIPSGARQHNQWGKGGITLASHAVPNPSSQWGGLSSSNNNHTISGHGVDLSKFGDANNTPDMAMAERRQRNREHAKRSRVRKKFMLESLQEDVRKLQRENTELRMIIQDKLPNLAQKIIEECCTSSNLFSDGTLSMEGFSNNSSEALMRSDFNLIQSLASSQQNFVLSDPRLPDNPIVYASAGFYELTGYAREQVLGRNCRFLQGPGTDPKHIDLIRSAVSKGNDFSVCILNYKADGTPFWNQLFVAALRDNDNCIVNFVSTFIFLVVFLFDFNSFFIWQRLVYNVRLKRSRNQRF